MDNGLIGPTGCARIIQVLDENHVDAVPGNVLEIGAFTGALTRFLAGWASAHSKQVIAVDPFTPTLDTTANDRGEVMADYYTSHLNERSQRDLYEENIAGCENVITYPVRSEAVEALLAEDAAFCFIFIDGSHRSDDVRADMQLAWKRLTAGGLLICHDYGHDLRQVHDTINAVLPTLSEWDAFVLPEIAAIGVRKHGA